MKQPILLLLSGLPASGKTTIGDKLSQELSIPMFTRDMFKEMMFDTFEWNDGGWTKNPEFSDKIGYVANSVLFKNKNPRSRYHGVFRIRGARHQTVS